MFNRSNTLFRGTVSECRRHILLFYYLSVRIIDYKHQLQFYSSFSHLLDAFLNRLAAYSPDDHGLCSLVRKTNESFAFIHHTVAMRFETNPNLSLLETNPFMFWVSSSFYYALCDCNSFNFQCFEKLLDAIAIQHLNWIEWFLLRARPHGAIDTIASSWCVKNEKRIQLKIKWNKTRFIVSN